MTGTFYITAAIDYANGTPTSATSTRRSAATCSPATAASAATR